MIVTIAEHSVDLSLLLKDPNIEKVNILDLGCRGFLFHDALSEMGYFVHCVDADKLETKYRQIYWHLAVTNYNGYCEVIPDKDPQAFRIGKKADDGLRCVTLDVFSSWVQVDFWDIIKIDIEGSEYEVIMSLTEPPAKQLSIEFHLHTKIYGDAQVKEMEDKLLSLGYFPVKHDKTSQHGLGFNYWDSLFILQS